MNQEEIKGINFDLPKNRSNVIKVIGVGGGGSNAINYMFHQGIKGVDFIITNTDAQALTESGVPTKIQLGASLTEGLGAGANPEVGARAAQESKDEIHSVLSTQTKMIFITAGMGGGTGTGAAPVIAQMAKSLDILTVGIVTMPFQFEGRLRLEQAQKGLERIKETVDALIVINNNKLREVYGNLGFKAGFAKADEVLATAARGIAEVITHHYTQNIDLKDAKTVLTNSGTAIMGSASSSGTNRAQEAIVKALDSPLLNDNKITGCQNVLLLIVSGSDEITIDEIGEINDYIQTEAGNHTNIIMGVGEDESLGDEISVTVIATGFGQEQQNEISNTEAKKIIHSLEDDQKIVHDLSEQDSPYIPLINIDEPIIDQEEIFHQAAPINEDPIISMNEILYDIEVDVDEVFNGIEKKSDLKELLTEEEVLISEEDSNFKILEGEEIKNEFSPIESQNSNEIAEMTKNEFSEISEEQLFEPQFDSVSEIFEKDNIEKINSYEESEVSLSDEEEFVFNDVNNSLFEMNVIDPEVIESESQILMDFDLTFSEKENQNSLTEQDLKKEVNIENTSLESDLEQAGLDVEFELKSESDKNFISQKNIDESGFNSELKNNSNPFEQSIDQTISSQSESRKAHLKAYNHQFSHQYQKVEEFEKEPAYKRKGLDLNDNLPEAQSRLSIENDGNNEPQIRSNNSFLHDNVD
jgi:cell division protein FtsZ